MTNCSGDEIISRTGEHNHPADARKREVTLIYAKAKAAAVTGTQTTQQCMIAAKEGASEGAL